MPIHKLSDEVCARLESTAPLTAPRLAAHFDVASDSTCIRGFAARWKSCPCTTSRRMALDRSVRNEFCPIRACVLTGYVNARFPMPSICGRRSVLVLAVLERHHHCLCHPTFFRSPAGRALAPFVVPWREEIKTTTNLTTNRGVQYLLRRQSQISQFRCWPPSLSPPAPRCPVLPMLWFPGQFSSNAAEPCTVPQNGAPKAPSRRAEAAAFPALEGTPWIDPPSVLNPQVPRHTHTPSVGGAVVRWQNGCRGVFFFLRRRSESCAFSLSTDRCGVVYCTFLARCWLVTCPTFRTPPPPCTRV